MFKTRKSKDAGEVNTSSTADIAFLLLIFFLVTTTINSEKGIGMVLPPKHKIIEPITVKERNVINLLINSANQVMIDNEVSELTDIKTIVKKFIDNKDTDPELSESPQKAIISIKADRGTEYDTYIKALDAVKAAYHELRAAHVGLTPAQFAQLDMKKPTDREVYEYAKDNYPTLISEADPNDTQ